MLSVALYRRQIQCLRARSARCTDARYDRSVEGFENYWFSLHAGLLIEPRMSEMGVRRGKAAFFSGCKSHPAIAPAGSNRSSHGGDEMAEAFGIACHELVSLHFRFGSRLCENSAAETFRAIIGSGR